MWKIIANTVLFEINVNLLDLLNYKSKVPAFQFSLCYTYKFGLFLLKYRMYKITVLNKIKFESNFRGPSLVILSIYEKYWKVLNRKTNSNFENWIPILFYSELLEIVSINFLN